MVIQSLSDRAFEQTHELGAVRLQVELRIGRKLIEQGVERGLDRHRHHPGVELPEAAVGLAILQNLLHDSDFARDRLRSEVLVPAVVPEVPPDLAAREQVSRLGPVVLDPCAYAGTNPSSRVTRIG